MDVCPRRFTFRNQNKDDIETGILSIQQSPVIICSKGGIVITWIQVEYRVRSFALIGRPDFFCILPDASQHRGAGFTLLVA